MKLFYLRRGYTLIEAIMVIMILAIIGFGFGNFIITSMQSAVFISGRETVTNTARSAMNRMVAELMKINRPQNIIIAATAECQFRDLDSSLIDFKQSGTNLLRNSDILATGLGSPEGLRFTYLNQSGSVTGVIQNIRSIRVWLYLASAGRVATLESSARIRNLQW